MFILFDVDKFKLVNDRYGHNMGDEVLIKVAEALTKVVSSGDIAMRLGGDEFAAYFPNIIDKAEGEAHIRKIFEQIALIHVDPDDKFEFPVFVGTLEEVAAYENVKPNSIVSAISHAKARKQVSKYKKVVL